MSLRSKIPLCFSSSRNRWSEYFHEIGSDTYRDERYEGDDGDCSLIDEAAIGRKDDSMIENSPIWLRCIAALKFVNLV